MERKGGGEKRKGEETVEVRQERGGIKRKRQKEGSRRRKMREGYWQFLAVIQQ